MGSPAFVRTTGLTKEVEQGGLLVELFKDHVFLFMAFVSFLATIVGVVVWLVRLEAGMKQNAADVRGLWRQRNEDLESHKQARQETNNLLEKIDKKVDAAFSELRTDVKALLRRKEE
jgi:predicted Holliday junction resolvase-like endonuclease